MITSMTVVTLQGHPRSFKGTLGRRRPWRRSLAPRTGARANAAKKLISRTPGTPEGGGGRTSSKLCDHARDSGLPCPRVGDGRSRD